MIIELWSLGKGDKTELSKSIELYSKRLSFYTKFKIEYIDNTKINKNQPKEKILSDEATLILGRLNTKDTLITLDEKGTEWTSQQFSDMINNWMVQTNSRIVFLIGGSYGISEILHQRAQAKMGLSKLTFPHQLVRLIFVEQLYRAFTILKNEKYHHE